MLSVMSYVVLTSAITGALSYNRFPDLFISLMSFSKVTYGCIYAFSLSGIKAVVLALFLMQFGCISVLCQVIGLAQKNYIPINYLLFSRMLCALLSSILTFILLRIFAQAAAASSNFSCAVIFSSPNRMVGSISLCAMFAIAFANASHNVNVDF